MSDRQDLQTARKKSRTASAGAKQRVGGFAFPALVWYSVFTVGPLIAMFWLALFDWRGLLAPMEFVGVAKYAEVLSDGMFWTSAVNTFVQLTVVLTIMMPAAFVFGYYLACNPRGHTVLRVAFFVPALISLAAKSMMFLAIFAPNGLVNSALSGVGLEALSTPWLANSSTAMAVIILVDLWGGVGFTAVLFAARIAGVPGEVFEAAEIDGAGHTSKIWRIAFPICRDYFGVLLMLQFIWILFSSAGQVLLLTNGGPGNASSTLSFLVYDAAFSRSDIGYSQAAAVILFAVGVLGVLAIRRIFNSEDSNS